MNSFLNYIKWIIVLTLLQSTSFAIETSFLILDDSSALQRHFLQITKENLQYKVIELEQEKGDFPYILKTLNFEQKSALEEYLGRFNSRSHSIEETLEDWVEIKEEGESTSSRKLFGIGGNNKNLWEVKNRWSQEWENKFSAWTSENVNEEFFVKYGLSTDCADAVLGIRWIFARIHSLPVANHISISSTLFTHLSMPKNWRKIPKGDVWHQDKLFMTALNYVMRLASTRTMLLDAYPVELTRRGLQVGSFVLTESKDSNHVKIISENNFSDPTDLPLFTLASTVPRKVRLLVREVITDQGWPKEDEKSFLKFRWPLVSNGSVYLQRASSHEDYSTEQFDSALREKEPIFIKFLLSRLKDSYDPKNLIELAIKDIYDYIQQRIEVVEQGAEFCQRNDCSIGTSNWDAWSTPSRDKKLKEKFKNIDLLASQFEVFSPGLLNQWKNAQLETQVSILNFSLSFKTIRYLLETGNASSEPSDSIEQRWGIDLENSAHTLLSEITELLKKRKEIIDSQWEACSLVDCYPKTSKWVSWNTFKVDEELLRNYNELDNLCEIYGSQVCFDLIFDDSISFDSGTKILSLREWVLRIPFFYSNLDRSLERRWGRLDESDESVIIKFKDNIILSSQDIALIDNSKILSLNSGESLYEANSGQSLMMAKNGEVLESSKELGKMKVGDFRDVILNFSIELEPFEHNDIVHNEVENFYSSASLKGVVLGHSNQRSKSVVIFDKDGKRLMGPSLAQIADDSETGIVFFPVERKIISFEDDKIIDLSKTFNDLSIEEKGISFSKLSIIALNVTESKFLFNYRDENYGVSYPILIQDSEILSLGLGETKNVKLEYFNLEDNIFFLEHVVTEEYPRAIVATIEDQKMSFEEVGNSFSQVVQNGSEYFFSVLNGGAWDQSRPKNFYKVDNQRIEKFSVPMNGSKLTLSHFGNDGVFLNNEDVYGLGAYMSLNERASVTKKTSPSYLRSINKLCSNVSREMNNFVEQFSYQHGDYNCFATVYADATKEKGLYTINYRSNDSFIKSIKNKSDHQLQFIGENHFIWWAKNTIVND